jgi:hypothetical protein
MEAGSDEGKAEGNRNAKRIGEEHLMAKPEGVAFRQQAKCSGMRVPTTRLAPTTP